MTRVIKASRQSNRNIKATTTAGVTKVSDQRTHEVRRQPHDVEYAVTGQPGDAAGLLSVEPAKRQGSLYGCAQSVPELSREAPRGLQSPYFRDVVDHTISDDDTDLRQEPGPYRFVMAAEKRPKKRHQHRKRQSLQNGADKQGREQSTKR